MTDKSHDPDNFDWLDSIINEDMPSDAYSSWEEKHPNARVFKLEFRNIGESNEWQEMIIIYTE